MKKNRFILSQFMAVLLLSLPATAQNIIKGYKATLIVTPRSSTVNVLGIKYDFFPKLQLIEMPKPGIGSEEDDSELNAVKARIHPDPNPTIYGQNKQSGTIGAPVKLRNFEGNDYDGGVPDDNSIAVSDSGTVLSARNSSLNVYDSIGGLIKSVSLDAFSSSLGLPQGKYDPRVLYDEGADRFIAVCLNGTDHTTTYAVVAFSQTNNPAGNWNLYKISGNPLNDTTWSDFPIIKITKNELFLTLNALHDNETWQKGFKQDYIWQISKDSGYAGKALQTKVHSGIVYNGANIRNICPVQGGSQLTGPESYFLSDKNFSNKTDSIFLLKLSGLLTDSSSTLTIKLLHSATNSYGVAPNAQQPSTAKVTRTLQTNDARILDGFIEGNTIQFVGNSVTSKGKAGIFHGILSNVSSSPTLAINILGDTLEFGYPAIAYAGLKTGDDDALIVIDHTSDTTDPGNSAMFYKNGSYSPSRRLYSGSSFAEISGANERWGDYSGAQRKYNEPGKAWVAAFYGRKVGSGLNTGPGNAARISEIQSPLLPLSAGILTEMPTIENIALYPVPSTSYTPIKVVFTSKEEGYYSFMIYDASGRLVTSLLNEKAQAGQNMFTFSTAPLKKGVYFLSISSAGSQYSQRFEVE